MLWVAVAGLAVLTLILGIAIGWYARDVRDRIHALYGLWRERLETPAGVVKPIVTRGRNRTQQESAINLGTDEEDDASGPVLRPTPTQARAMDELGEESILAATRIRRERVRRL